MNLTALAYLASILQKGAQLDNNAETGVLPQQQARNNPADFGGALNEKQLNFKLNQDVSSSGMNFMDLTEQTYPEIDQIISDYEHDSGLNFERHVTETPEYQDAFNGMYEGLFTDNPEMLKLHLKTLMELGEFDINSPKLFNYETTILLMAVSLNDMRSMKCIKMLLEEMGADPNIGYKNDWDALVFASESGNVKLMELLLANGAEVNRPEMQVNALIQALRQNQVESVKLLLKSGADINFREPESNLTALDALEIANEHGSDSSRLIKQYADAKRQEKE